MVFLMDILALGQDFHDQFRFPSSGIIPPAFHTHLSSGDGIIGTQFKPSGDGIIGTQFKPSGDGIIGTQFKPIAITCSRWFLASGFFYPEDGGDTFLRNVSSYKIYTAPHLRRRNSSK
jgi:hypothetical protein